MNGANRYDEKQLARLRKRIHVIMAVVMMAVVLVFYHFGNDSVINLVFKVAGYTYGPILGLFVFGMFSKRRVIDRLVPVVCIAAPVASWFIQYYLNELWQYKVSFELLIINALLTVVGMFILSVGKKQN